jgi:hypothetical protein
MNKKSESTLKVMGKTMRVNNYSARSIETYIHYASKFLAYFNKDPYHINQTEINHYLLNFNYSSVSQQNQMKHIFTMRLNFWLISIKIPIISTRRRSTITY